MPVLAAVALVLPGAAYPYSLAQLLQLPLERLLQLQITTRRATLEAQKVKFAVLSPRDLERHR